MDTIILPFQLLRFTRSLRGRAAKIPHQIRQRSERTIGSPALQPNAAANSGRFEGAPIARKRPSGWGFVLVCKRSNSGRAFIAHTLAQFKKRRCSGVKPSISGGRGFPARLFPKAL